MKNRWLSWNNKLALRYKWEENRGMGSSFGYNRNEDISDYKTAAELVHLLINTVSMNGNLLLNIGPTADGRIPVIMQERLIEIGKWLAINAEAIYGTRPWRETREGDFVRYTCKSGIVYAICLHWPGPELILRIPKPAKKTEVTLVGNKYPLKWRHVNDAFHVDVPPLSVDQVPCRHAYVFRLTEVQ